MIEAVLCEVRPMQKKTGGQSGVLPQVNDAFPFQFWMPHRLAS